MVIPIEKISEVVAETFRQIKTGVKTVRDEGVAIVELPDSKFGAQGVQFTMTVIAKDGRNAVPRTQTQEQVTQAETEQLQVKHRIEQVSIQSSEGSDKTTTTYAYE